VEHIGFFRSAPPSGTVGSVTGNHPVRCLMPQVFGSVTLRARVGWPGERLANYYPTRVETGAMRCIECDAADVSERRERTTRGYRRFRCRACDKQFNERSGGNSPSRSISVRRHRTRDFWRLRYKLSLRDLPEMFLIRGIVSYEAVRDWEAKLTPTLIDNLRRRRTGRMYVDESVPRQAA